MKFILVLLATLVLLVQGALACTSEITDPQPANLGEIPSKAEFVFISQDSNGVHISVMDKRGKNVRQITETARNYSHAAVSPDRTMIVTAVQEASPPVWRLWLFNIKDQTEAQLLPAFYSAGDGGVDWDQDGYIYFAATPTTPPHSDIYRIRPDGTGLEQLTTTGPFEKDVSVSEDGTMMTYVTAVPGAVPTTVVWVANTDGTGAHPVYQSGQIGIESAHDPELSPDNSAIVFSMVNPDHINFPDTMNTAHDLFIIALPGGSIERITSPGGIQVMPDWVGNRIVYTDINELDGYRGMAIINDDGAHRRRFGPLNGRMIKWIP